jgi:hypothetical protein
VRKCGPMASSSALLGAFGLVALAPPFSSSHKGIIHRVRLRVFILCVLFCFVGDDFAFFHSALL